MDFLIALPLGYLLAKSPLADRLLSPYLIASQAIPVIAIAPLLTIWVASAYWARVWVAVLVVFFPILVSSVTGMRSVPAELYELMHSLRATRGQIFRKLEIPASMPVLLAGLKVGATLAVIGTLVGEFVQPKSEGLGFLLVTARYQFKTDLGLCGLINTRDHCPNTLWSGRSFGKTSVTLAPVTTGGNVTNEMNTVQTNCSANRFIQQWRQIFEEIHKIDLVILFLGGDALGCLQRGKRTRQWEQQARFVAFSPTTYGLYSRPAICSFLCCR